MRPFDAADRPIMGCPATGPTISDPAGAVEIASVDFTSWQRFCELTLAWTDAPVATTIVVRWGTREAALVIAL